VLDYPQSELAEKWRERAKEMRALAQTMNDPESRVTMVRLADLYDHLANLGRKRRAGADNN